MVTEDLKKKIEDELNNVMEHIPAVEGLIAFKLKKGEILAGQTLTELNHNEIVEYSMAIVNGASSLGKVVDKGKISEIDIDLANGFAVVINSGDIALTALAGQDARAELGLVRLNLKTALENIANLLK
jgi:predicted regulator of Ras-like GTPase activity (Roadblock/LC7/MglB family)